MRRIHRTKRRIAAAATVALLGAVVVSAAQAASSASFFAGSADSADSAAKGIPAFVNPETDLGSHAPGQGLSWNDSIYFTSDVRADGHDYGLLVHTIQLPNVNAQELSFSVTDTKTGWYKNYVADIATADYHWSRTGLDISMPGLTWTGDAQRMAVNLTTPWSTLDLTLEAKGPVLDYASTGYWNLLGDPNYEFALPAMRTTGTFSINGTSRRVSGTSWLDRQWGPVPIADSDFHWTWMNLSLPNGDKVAVWDTVSSTQENVWATVLHPDGSYAIAVVRPLVQGAGDFWKSPTSAKVYPTRWRVEIPALDAHLDVAVTGTGAQELTGAIGTRYEGTAAFTGSYEGKHVSGDTEVEMVGNWPA